MTEPNPNTPATVPDQPEARLPLKKGMPVVIALVAILAILGIANVASLLKGNKKAAPASSLPMRPASPSAQQVSSFQQQQKLQAEHDVEEKQRQQELLAAMQQFGGAPGPESATAPPMTAAQRDAIYGGGSNAPQRTSNASEAQAQAKQQTLAREKQKQDAINSGTVAIDFAHSGEAANTPTPNPQAATVLTSPSEAPSSEKSEETTAVAGVPPQRSPNAVPASEQSPGSNTKADPMGSYPFDQYQGRLYRIFEGTVLEGVVTNHIDGGFNGPILVMLTADYYSHDNQQLLMPQGTRLIGAVESVGNAQQRKMFVTFHRAVCPDGFSLDFDKYIGLDPIGTTGLATKVDHGYFQAFAAAAAIGGLGGLAQIGNQGSVLDPSTEIRNGISQQTASEGEQILNHFLNRLPIITLKEGSRARIYVGRDVLIPSYSEHRMDPAL